MSCWSRATRNHARGFLADADVASGRSGSPARLRCRCIRATIGDAAAALNAALLDPHHQAPGPAGMGRAFPGARSAPC